jgi:hypothetical protein
VLVEMESDGGGGEIGRLAIALIGATNVGRTTLAFSDLRGNDQKARIPRDFNPSTPLHLP